MIKKYKQQIKKIINKELKIKRKTNKLKIIIKNKRQMKIQKRKNKKKQKKQKKRKKRKNNKLRKNKQFTPKIIT